MPRFAAGVSEIPVTVTIADNENPVFSVVDVNVQVTESEDAEIEIQITNPSATPVSFTYSTSVGTASSLDFEGQTATAVRFDPMSGNLILNIPITSDEIDEIDEEFTVTFADLTGATFTGGTAPEVTVTIQDDDQAEIYFTSSSVYNYEYYVTSRGMEFNLRLSKASSRDISVDWEASSDNLPNYYRPATRGVDYAIEPDSHRGTAVIPAGRLTTTVSIPVVDDDIDEYSTEYLSVTLANATNGAIIRQTSARGYIYDDDDSPVISTPTEISASESNGNIEIPIELSNRSDREVSFRYSTGSIETNNATRGLDYQAITSYYHSIPSLASTSMISIPILEDDLYEGPESFTVVLFEPQNAQIQRDTTSQYSNERYVTVTIIDAQEPPVISFADMTPRVNESDNSVTIRANLSSSTNRAISVSYSTTNMTATGGTQSGSGTDYQTQSNQTLNFDAGASYADITIPIYQDNSGEGEETFALTLSNPIGAEFANVRSTLTTFVTIVDDESPLLSAPAAISVSERVGLAPIELQLNGPTSRDVEVSYSTSIDAGSNAAQQADFTSQPFATVIIPESSTTGIIYIPITNDTISESDETFTVRLSGISGASFDGGSSIDIQVTIKDDEGLPTLTVDLTSIEITEGDGSAEIGLSLSSAASGPVTVTYSTIGKTATNDGTDYTVRNNETVRITSGTSGSISIPIMDDAVLEDNETFVVSLTGVSGAAFGIGTNKINVEVTIIDKEPLPTLLVPFKNVYALESGNAVINIRLSKLSDSPVSFTYSTSPSSATSTDFIEQSSITHTITTGVRSRIQIPITSDQIDETDEQFTITFDNLRGATFGTAGAPSVTVTIEDDDQSSFIVGVGSGMESSTEITYVEFPLSLSKVSSRDTSVTWTASTELTDEAVRGVDFAVETNSHTGVVRIPAGSSSTTILVPIADDDFAEPTESFHITLSNPTGGADIQVGSAIGTIRDNDTSHYRPVLMVPTTVSVSESDGHVAIPLNLSYKAGGSVNVYYSTNSITANSSSDFISEGSTVHVFPENTTTTSILVPIVNDSYYEGPETFNLYIYSISGADFPLNPSSQYSYYNDRLGSLEIIVTIFDDEPKPVLSFADMTPEIDETANTLTIRTNLSHTSTKPASIKYSTADITATGGSGSESNADYQTQTEETLNIPAEASYVEFEIPIYDDSMKEGNQTFAVTLSDANGVTFAGQSDTLTTTVTIVDDESPTLSVVDTNVDVGEREGYAAIELMLSGSTDEDVVVTYATTREQGDTAEAADYTVPNPQRATISSSKTTGEIRIPIVNDTEQAEGNETFTVTLTGVTNAEFAGGSNIVVKVTIIDDEGLPTLTVDSDSVEVYEGLGPAEIGITLDSTPSGNVEVTYSTEDVTADETDYTPQTDQTITISGATTGKISIPITSDSNYEGNEIFNVNITDVSGAAFEENVREISKSVTILDDEPVSTLSVQSTSVATSESGNAEIVLKLENPSNEVVSLTYSTNTGTASASDFVAQNKVLHTFSSETTSTISIPIISDEIDEVDENFTVTFADLKGATFGNAGSPTVSVTIEDDDQAKIFFANTHEYLSEGDANTRQMVFNLRLTTVSSRDISVSWEATSRGLSAYFPDQYIATRGVDYAVAPNPYTGTAVFPAGSLTATLQVQIEDDTIDDDLECFTVVLSNPTGGALIGNQSTLGVINNQATGANESNPNTGINVGNTSVLGHIDDDDDSPTITTLAAVSGREADGEIEIPINLSHETNEEVTVYYSTTSGIAKGDGIDFENISDLSHVIPNNTTSSKIIIPIIDDELFEGNETFTVTLSDPIYAQLPNSQVSQYSGQSLGSMEINVTIFDDETKPVISFEDLMPQVNESDSTLTLRAYLSNASAQATSLTYSTTNGSATGGTGSGSGVDYETQTNQVLNFPIGQEYADITIPIFQDETVEGDETFTLTLSNPSNAEFPDSASELMLSVTLVDDEMPTLSVVDSTLKVNRSVGIATVEVQLSTPTTETVEVTYSTSIESGDTAVATDFEVLTSEKVSIISLSSAGVIAIPIKDNPASSGDKTFTLTLSEISGATFAGGTSNIVKKVRYH